jgi:hypothetical protein
MAAPAWLVALAVAAAPTAAPPWEVWRDLAQLAVVRTGHQVVLRSSHCPSGCRFDRTSPGDTRFLRIEGDEQVVLEETGPGAIARIWVTSGTIGPAVGIEPHLRVRIRVDGAAVPAVDVPLAALFSGQHPPFVPPLVRDERASSGGFVSYVPIPYRTGCKDSIVGVMERPVWFQFTLHRLAQADGVRTFRGDEDLSGLARLLGSAGPDPWDDGAGTLEQRSVELPPFGEQVLRRYEDAGTWTGLRLRVPPEAWPVVRLRLSFDDETRVDLPLADFFGALPGPGMRSALVGVDDAGLLYSWLPMPFERRASARLVNDSGAPVAVWYETRRRIGRPAAGSVPFAAQSRGDDPTGVGTDFGLAFARGRGKWVGLVADLASVGPDGREYLEGDERVYVDGSPSPALYGTGVEDLFGGGFYFLRGPFRLPTHGAPAHLALANGDDRTTMYRMFLTDALPFTSALRAGLEGGPTGNLAVRARRVAYLYRQDAPALVFADALDVGDDAARLRTRYESGADEHCARLEGSFEGEPETPLPYVACERTAGASAFTARVPPGSSAVRLRRRFDATLGEQAATVFVNGREAGRFPPVEPNAFRPLREIDLDLPAWAGGPGMIRITIVPDGGPFTEIRWEVWSGR